MKTNISFDGETFEMHIPSMYKYQALLKFLRDKEYSNALSYFTNPILTQMSPNRTTLVFQNTSIYGSESVGKLIGDTVVANNGAPPVLLQPVLLPVDKDGIGIEVPEESFFTGSFADGGSLYQDSAELTMFPGMFSNGLTTKAPISWGDTQDRPMRYIIFEHMYWCMSPIALGTLDQIFSNWDWQDC